ncbi:hypothetical protein P4V48_28965, partial [Bacillus thuringiensis]|nr:hypothetical protein [Bacillus thuringiensis]
NISSVGFNSFASFTALANVLTPLDAFAPFVIWPIEDLAKLLNQFIYIKIYSDNNMLMNLLTVN